MAPDGFSHLKGSKKVGNNEEKEVDDVSCNIDAAENCPATCIYVYENGKKIIWNISCETNYTEANYV